jgi:hypothetical protein
MKKLTIGVVFILLSILIFILYQSRINHFVEPDTIIVYKDGMTKTFYRDDKLYTEIVKHIDNRINSDLHVVKLGFHKDDMDILKQHEVLIEFIYSEKQKSKYWGSVGYTHLLFPLTGEYNDLYFMETNNGNNYSGPIGILKSSEDVLDLLD